MQDIKPSKITFHRLNWLEWLSIGFSLWFLISPKPYKILFIIVLCLPIIGLILNGLSRPSVASLVSISNQDGKNKYDLADFIEFPGLVIFLRVLIDFQYESFYSIIKVGTTTLSLLFILLAVTHKYIDLSNNHRGIIYIIVFANITLYSYAATYGINCVFDNSEPKIFQAKVVDKSISHGKHKTYYLRIEAWGSHHDEEDISVSSAQYNETSIGQTVSIDYKNGFLNIPWYYIE